MLRVLQEALTNVVKHAQASHVSVRLARVAEGIRLDVEDDGRGFDARTPASHGRGLANMRARAERLDARLETCTQPGATRITLAVPVPVAVAVPVAMPMSVPATPAAAVRETANADRAAPLDSRSTFA